MPIAALPESTIIAINHSCFWWNALQLPDNLRSKANQEMGLELSYNIVFIVFYSRHPTQDAF
jgi:hypothetical protein